MKKKIFTALAVMMLASLFHMPVLAGDINENEQRIIAAISAIYEYDGAYYKVTDAYISQVTTYLSDDNIDLSASEVNDYLNQFYASIAVGISSGYMECVGKVEEEKKPASSETEEIDSSEDEKQDEGSEHDSDDNDENSPESATEEVTTEEIATISEETGMIIEGAIKVTNLGVEETAGDNTRGSTISGIQEYTVAEVEQQPMYVWDIEELTVHTEAYKDSEIIGTLLKGDKVIVTGAATTGWARIEYEDGIGYVSSAYLRTPGYMIENGHIEPETMETEEISSEEETTVSKDYSDAEPYQKGISLGVVAVITAVIVMLAMVVIILVHRNKHFK